MRMHNNPLWFVFLAAIGLGVMWYSGHAAWKLYHYYALTSSTQPEHLTWQVKPISDEDYVPTASYTYVDAKTELSVDGSWSDRPFRNRWAAEQSLPEYTAKPWTVWYAPGSKYSSLQKSFPVKECISAAVLWLLLLYFIWLGFYVTRYRI